MKSQNTRSQNTKSYARSMAPSQKAKMVKIEGITSTFTSTVREDFKVNGLSFSVNLLDRVVYVQSGNFPGWFYLVRWAEEGIDQCSCGKPNGCEHTREACRFTQTYVKPTPVVKAPLPCSVEWYAARREEERAARIAQKDEEVFVAQIKSEFARIVVEAIAANINAQFSKVVVQRGIVALSQNEAA